MGSPRMLIFTSKYYPVNIGGITQTTVVIVALLKIKTSLAMCAALMLILHLRIIKLIPGKSHKPLCSLLPTYNRIFFLAMGSPRMLIFTS